MNKILVILATLGVAGATIVFDGSCVDENGFTMYPAEELILREYQNGEVVETAKVCFPETLDYEKYKDNRIGGYKGKSPEERAKYLLTVEGRTLGDIITHEIKKTKNKTLEFKIVSGDDIVLKHIEALEKLKYK